MEYLKVSFIRIRRILLLSGHFLVGVQFLLNPVFIDSREFLFLFIFIHSVTIYLVKEK